MTAPKIVVPDQCENWIDISCTAQFVTHQAVWPKNSSDENMWHYCSALLNFTTFDLNFLLRV